MKKQARDIAKTSNGNMEVFLQKKRKLMVKLSIQRFQFHY